MSDASRVLYRQRHVWLTELAVHSCVSTDAYRTLEGAHDPEPNVLTPDESARMMGKVVSRDDLSKRDTANHLEQFEQATMETHHGRYFNYDGKEL